MIIRNVCNTDATAIANIYNEYVTGTTVSFELEPVTVGEMLKRIIEISASFPYFVCEDKGNVVGFCYAHRWKERKAYENTLETTVYISRSHHGHGVGRQLMERLIDACRTKGCHALIACITGDNEPSINFHERLGFTKVSHFKQVGRKFGRWLDVVDYELLLTDGQMR